MNHPIKAIRRAGVPIAAFETSDPAMTIVGTVKAMNGKACAVLQWDVMRGLTAVNQEGQPIAAELSPEGAISTGNPAECLSIIADRLPEGSMVFFHNAHRLLEPPNLSVNQGIWNCRDAFKSRGCTLILMAPAIQLPDELKQDCVVITEPLPTAEEIGGIVDSLCADAGMKEVENKANVVDTLLGLSAFSAEQALAMSITKEGIDRPGLWERKRKMIEQTPGLSVWRGKESFAEIAGYDNAKGFISDVLKGQAAPRAICFIDEIEKALAGTAGDSSGVSQDYLSALLTFMQDKEATGMIFIGPPGSGKSAVAKAAGNEANVPTVQIDLGGMKDSLVGSSERRLRQALQVVDAVSQGQTLFLATCNSFGTLPPELKRRFTLGTFFFDLPTAEECKAIWKIYIKKYALKPQELPSHDGWTGAEIKQCCQIAWRLGRTLQEASQFIVPVAKSSADIIDNLRGQASGRFISASKPGVYQLPTRPTGRKLGI